MNRTSFTFVLSYENGLLFFHFVTSSGQAHTAKLPNGCPDFHPVCSANTAGPVLQLVTVAQDSFGVSCTWPPA